METVLGRAVRMAKGIYFQAICGPVKRIVLFKQEERRTFLVVQWVRTHLPRQGIQVQSLVWEDCTCFRAAKPVCHNCWAHCSNCWSLCAWNLSFAREAAAVRRLHTTSRECSQSTQLEKVHAKQWRLSATKKKKRRRKSTMHSLIYLKVCHIDVELTCSLWFQRKIWGPLHMFDVRHEFLIELFKATSIQVTGFSPVIHFNNLPTCLPGLVQSHFTWPCSLLTVVQPHWFSSFTSLNSPQGP